MSAVTNNTSYPAPPATSGVQPPVEHEQQCFNYTGLDKLGRPEKYYLYATDEEQATRVLEHAGITEVQVWPRRESRQFRRKKVSRKDRGLLLLQLAERLDADQKMSYAVEEMAKSSTHPTLREALFDVKKALKDDVDKPADAFRKRVDVFGIPFCQVLEVATSSKAGGDPVPILVRYGNSQIKTAENISRMIGAAIYPSVILVIATIILFVLCYFVMPQMEEMYQGLLETTQAELPLPTEILLAVSHFMIGPGGIVVVAGIIGGVIFAFKKARTREGTEYLQRKSLRWPVVGPLLRALNAAYTVHLLAILADVITPKEALAEISAASLNIVYQEKLASIRKALAEDKVKLSTAIAPYGFFFGDDFHAAVRSAEESEGLTQLERHAELLDKQVEEKIKRASSLIEPLTITIAGTVIFLIVLSFYLPMFELIGKLANKH